MKHNESKNNTEFGIKECPECSRKNTSILMSPERIRNILCWDCRKLFVMEKFIHNDNKPGSGMILRIKDKSI